MAINFFRKAALEKLSTPEKLDQLIRVVGYKGWIALITLSITLTTGIAWAFLGNIKTKVNATGVLLGGDIHDIVSTSQGPLVKLKVNVGDFVKKGDIIAEIQQSELGHQIDEIESSLREKEHDLLLLLSYGNQDTKFETELIAQQKSSLELQLASDKNNLVYLKNQFEIENNLLDKGLITKSQVMNTKQQIEATKSSIEGLKGKLVKISSQKLDISFDLKQKINTSKEYIEETKRRLTHLKEQYDFQTNIRSPYEGKVVEVLTESGVVVSPGTPLFKLKNLVLNNDQLRGILYIPSQDGKKIKKGMQALVVPSTVQPQEFGFMKGKVTYVSDFPITRKGMMMTVKNDQLVQGMLSMGALFEVYVEFEKDIESYSGFKWTSAKGPEILINEGTSCLGKITVKTEPPITVVIPALKKFFDLY